MTTSGLLTIKEVAAILGVSRSTVSDLVLDRKLRVAHRGGRDGRTRYFAAAEVEAMRLERIRRPPYHGWHPRGRL